MHLLTFNFTKHSSPTHCQIHIGRIALFIIYSKKYEINYKHYWSKTSFLYNANCLCHQHKQQNILSQRLSNSYLCGSQFKTTNKATKTLQHCIWNLTTKATESYIWCLNPLLDHPGLHLERFCCWVFPFFYLILHKQCRRHRKQNENPQMQGLTSPIPATSCHTRVQASVRPELPHIYYTKKANSTLGIRWHRSFFCTNNLSSLLIFMKIR